MQQNKVNANVKKIIAMSLVAALSSGSCAFHANAQMGPNQYQGNNDSSESNSNSDDDSSESNPNSDDNHSEDGTNLNEENELFKTVKRRPMNAINGNLEEFTNWANRERQHNNANKPLKSPMMTSFVIPRGGIIEDGTNLNEENINNPLFSNQLMTPLREPHAEITEEERGSYEDARHNAELNAEERRELLNSVYRRDNDENPEETLNSDSNAEENNQRRGLLQFATGVILSLFMPCFKGVFGSYK